MLHASITERYVRHRNVYTRLLRLAFALSGLYWIVIYLLPHEVHNSLRAGQSVIYLILMSLWGVDYMREQLRLSAIIAVANERRIPPDEVEFSDVAHRASIFTMIVPSTGFWGKSIPVGFLAGIVAAYVLVVMQYLRAVAML